MRRSFRGLRPLVVAALGLCVAWVASEPGRARYLANALRQVRHLPGRYAV